MPAPMSTSSTSPVSPSPNRALLLSGGATRGPLMQVTLENLARLHQPHGYAVIEGVSMGSLEAPCYALGLLPALRELYDRIHGTGFFLRPNVEHLQQGLNTLKPLEKIYRDLIGPYWDRLRTGPVDVRVGIFDLDSDRYRTIHAKKTKDFDEWVHATMASCAMHPIMDHWPLFVEDPDRIWREHRCVDGGFAHVIPWLADWKDFDAIDVGLHSEKNRINPRPAGFQSTLVETTNRVLDALVDQVVKSDLQRLQGWANAGKIVTLYAPPCWPGDSMDASRKTMQWRLQILGPKVWDNAEILT